LRSKMCLGHIMTRKLVFAFQLSRDRVSSSSDYDVDHVDTPSLLQLSCSAIINRNSLLGRHRFVPELRLSEHGPKVPIVIAAGSNVLEGRI